MAKALISRHKASIAVLLCGMAFGITGAMTINVRAASVVLPQIAPEGVVQGEFEVTTSAKGDETLIVPLHVSAETPRLAFRAQHVSGAVRPIGYSGYAEVRYDHYTTQLTLSDGSTWQFSTPGATSSSATTPKRSPPLAWPGSGGRLTNQLPTVSPWTNLRARVRRTSLTTATRAASHQHIAATPATEPPATPHARVVRAVGAAAELAASAAAHRRPCRFSR